MGLDVTATHFVWFVALFSLSAMAYGSVMNAHDDVGDSLRDRHDLERVRMATTLGAARTDYDAATDTLTLTIKNTGKATLDASAVTLVLDGALETGFTVAAGGNGASTVWLPGEDAVFTLPGQAGAPSRVRVLSGDGVTASTVFPAGPVVTVVVLPDPVDVGAGETQDFEARAFDVNWRRVTSASFTWTTDAGSMATLTGSTARLTAQTTLGDGLSVTATESGSGVTGSATVNVVAGPVATITVTPDPVTVAPSTTRQFSASGEDQYGNPVTLDSLTWSASVGSITSDGVYTAPASDTADTVTASQDGVDGTASVTVRQLTYASATYADYAGGTVTNAAAWTQATGDVATLTEDNTPVTRTRPATQNDRDFEASPVSGWSASVQSGGGTLAQTEADGTPTATGALAFTTSGGGQTLVHVEHAWTQTTQASPTDATFSMDYRFPSGSHPNRYLEVWLVKPDGTSVQIGARHAPGGTTWTAFGATTVPAAEITDSGTYTLRILAQFQGNGDSARFDNVELTWTTDDGYRFGKELTVTSLPEGTGASHTLEVHYRVSSGSEGLQLWVEGPTDTWTQRATLSETTLTVASIPLTADDVTGSAVNLRFVDATQTADATQGSWDVEYVRVSSSG